MSKLDELEKEIEDFNKDCKEKKERREAKKEILVMILDFREALRHRYEDEDMDDIDDKLLELAYDECKKDKIEFKELVEMKGIKDFMSFLND